MFSENICTSSSETKTWCCPFINSAKVNKHLPCVNKDCRKKKRPQPVDGKERCNNPTSKRKMFVNLCKEAINPDILLTVKANVTKQITVTLFDPALVTAIDMNKEKSKIEYYFCY